MSDTLTLLYILPCIYYAYVTFFFLFIYFFFFCLSPFVEKIVPPPLFFTELHNYLTSLNEILLAPGTNIHTCFHPSLLLVFGFIEK